MQWPRRQVGHYTFGQLARISMGSLFAFGEYSFLLLLFSIDSYIFVLFDREEHYDPSDKDAMKFLSSKEFQAVEAGFRNYLAAKFSSM